MSDQRVRPSARDTYHHVKRDAAEELSRAVPALAFSGLFAGATPGFSACCHSRGHAGGRSKLAAGTGGWMIEASDHAIGQMALIWEPDVLVAVGTFVHCVSTTSEVPTSVSAAP